MFELFFLLREDAFCCEMKRKFKKSKTERREYINIYVFIFLSFIISPTYFHIIACAQCRIGKEISLSLSFSPSPDLQLPF